MEKREKDRKDADRLIHEAMMNEGDYWKEKLDPVTYEDPEGYDINAGFQRLLKERAKLKAETLEYEAKVEGESVKMESATVETSDDKIRTFETVKAQNDNKGKKLRKGFGSFVKAAVVVLAAGACIAGFSLQSEATRMWWMESLGWHFGDDSTTKVNNDYERDPTELPEWEAVSAIENEIGIKAPKLQYQPEGMEFSDYMYETVTNSAVMYYKMEEEYITINMIVGLLDTASSANFDGDVLMEDVLETTYGVVYIREIEGKNNTKNTVVVEWDYQDAHYEIFGRISVKEMKKIVENIIL